MTTVQQGGDVPRDGIERLQAFFDTLSVTKESGQIISASVSREWCSPSLPPGTVTHLLERRLVLEISADLLQDRTERRGGP
jgi:hypothetical protein